MTTITCVKLDQARAVTVSETALFRRLQQELTSIQKQLEQSSLKDNTTKALGNWCNTFSEALRKNTDTSQLLKDQIEVLKNILIDPLTGQVVEEQAVLGNDGVMYGRKACKIWEACLLAKEVDISILRQVIAPQILTMFSGLDRRVRVESAKRSPLSPTTPAFFIAQPYPIISLVRSWLESYDKSFSAQEVNSAYQWLVDHPQSAVREESIEGVRAVVMELTKMRTMLNDGFTKHSLEHLVFIRREEERLMQVFAEVENTLSLSDKSELYQQVKEVEAKVVEFSRFVRAEMSGAATAPLRRRLTQELKDIGEVLETSSLQDETTEQLRAWHGAFTQCLLRNKDIALVLEDFIGILYDILTDPLTNEVIGNRPLLGSDGGIYGFESLAIFKACLLVEGQDIERLKEVMNPQMLVNTSQLTRENRILYSQRSPMDMENPAIFTTRPHLVMTTMLEWLSGYGARPSTKRIETTYQWFLEHLPHTLHRSDVLPRGSLEERMARKLEKSIGQRQRLAAADESFAKEFEKLQMLPGVIAQTQAAFDEQLTELTSSIMQQLETLEASELQQYQAVMREVKVLTQGAAQLTADLSQVKYVYESIHDQVEVLDAEQKRMKQEIEKLRKEMKKRRRRARFAIIRAVCTVAAVICVNVLLPPGVGVSFQDKMLHIGFGV